MKVSSFKEKRSNGVDRCERFLFAPVIPAAAFAFHQSIPDQFTPQTGCVFVITAQYLVDLFSLYLLLTSKAFTT